jgi:hypothetical protein
MSILFPEVSGMNLELPPGLLKREKKRKEKHLCPNLTKEEKNLLENSMATSSKKKLVDDRPSCGLIAKGFYYHTCISGPNSWRPCSLNLNAGALESFK